MVKRSAPQPEKGPLISPEKAKQILGEERPPAGEKEIPSRKGEVAVAPPALENIRAQIAKLPETPISPKEFERELEGEIPTTTEQELQKAIDEKVPPEELEDLI